MKEDGTPESSGHAFRPTDHGTEVDEDVLRSIPLPGWSIFDAVFISWHDHPEAETSGGAFIDTPIARIQRYRRRSMIVIASLLLLSAISRIYSYTSAPSIRNGRVSESTGPGRLSRFFAWTSVDPPSSSLLSSNNRATLAGYPLSSAYYAALYNASAIPARVRPSQARMSMLQAIAKSRSSGYNPADFINNHEAIMSHAKSGGDPMDFITRKAPASVDAPVLRPHVASAIIVHSPDYDISSTQLIIDMASKYPFVREIIVWNNDIGLYISERSLEVPTIEDLGFLPPSLRVINSPLAFAPLSSPVHRWLPASRAKHLACGLASKAVCLFLSPSLLPIHLDSLYTSFLSTAPTFSQIVSIVTPGDQFHLAHLRFENDDIDLHSGILLPGIAKSANSDFARDGEMQESIARRALSKRFIHQLETMTPVLHGEEADIYWSLWSNTMPKLLTAPALAIHDAEPASPVRAPASQLQKARDIMMLHALRSLHSILSAQDPFLSPDPFPIAPSPPHDSSRAPCHDDKCIFESNMSPFTRTPSSLLLQKMRPGKKGALSPDQTTPARKAISSSAFNPFTHIESMEDYRAAWHDSGDSATAGAFPASIIDFQRQSNWYLAVNGRHPSVKTLQNDSTSCWITPASIDKGSFFGLNFLGSKPVHIVKVIGSANLGNIVGKGQEDLTAESWEVWTKQDDDEDTLDSDTREDKNEWSRRALRGKVISVRIGDSPLYVHSIALAPLVNYHTSVPAGNRENVHGQSSGQTVENGDESEEDEQILRKRDLHIEEAESDEATHDETNDDREKPLRALEPTDTSILSEAAPVTGIRFISRDRKSQPVKFCGFDIDGWIV